MANIFNRVKSAGLDRFGFRVTVEEVHSPAAGFVAITLVGAGVREHAWRAGDRVSVRTPDDFLRNYTPFDWDASAGRARLLGVGRAPGPGTRYLSSLTVGSTVQLLGPKRSINLDFETPPIIVGDETVLGLCAAWNSANRDGPATVLLEAADTAACHAAATAVGVATTKVVESSAQLVAATLAAVADQSSAPLVLSGKAQTIAAVRRALKDARMAHGSPTRTIVKAYWDENRAGLD